MRRFFLDLFILLVAIGIVILFRDAISRAWNQFPSQIFSCVKPIEYSIGDFDPRFGISKETFLKDIQKSESIWETPIKRELFVYKPDGALKFNLIFDDRQLATQKLQKAGLVIHDDTASYDKLKVRYDALQKTIANLKASYQVQSDVYDSRLAAYNKEVTSLNKRGGASQDVVDRLNQEKLDLDVMIVSLKALQDKVNANIDELNALAEVINRIARSLNLAAVEYNKVGASRTGEFEEGEYMSGPSGNRINIYQFDDQAKLIRMLTHELGHALGLDHLDNPKAIMYRLNNGVNESLTADDLAALKKQCGIK